MSILDGVGDLVDDWLELDPKGKPPYYRHRAAAKALSQRRSPIAGTKAFLDATYALIHRNWMNASYAKPPSKENWRWKRHLELGEMNVSPELQLERAIVNACGDDWSNQMPTASGLIGPAVDKRAAVDLVYRKDAMTYSFIELKVASDTPLFAAIEILMYGLLFVWSKNNQKELGYDLKTQPVLVADNVTLSVLAPSKYYEGFDLTALASALNNGLVEFGQRNSVALSFEFSQLGADYAPDLQPEHVKLAIEDRRRIWIAE